MMNSGLGDAKKDIMEYEQMAKKWKNEFMRKTYELLSIVDISKGAALHLNINELADLILSTIRGYIKAQHIYFFLRNENKPEEFVLIDSVGLVEDPGEMKFSFVESSILKKIRIDSKVMKISELDKDPAFKKDVERLKSIDAVLFLPVHSLEKLKGFIVVGPKVSGMDYSEADEDFLKTIGNLTIISIENAQYLEMMKQTLWRTICIFVNMIESKHPYLRGHARKVTEMSMKVAEKIELTKGECELLEYAGMLHDIGLVGVSEYILCKTEKLSEQEFDIIQKHPVLSSEILAPIGFFSIVREIIVQHHERYNGHGYPKGLKQDQILVQARIIAIVDAYEAMVSDRPYRETVSHFAAIEEIKRYSGIQFDPKIVDVFVEIFG